MRRLMFTLLLPAVLCACGGDQSQATAPPATTGMATPAATAMPAASPTMVPADQMTIRAEVVKVDTTAKSVTLRDVASGTGGSAAPEKMMTVEDAALLSGLKAGDDVAVTCRTSMTVPLPATTTGGTTTPPAAGTPATDMSALASVNGCQGVIGIAPSDAAAATTGTTTPAGGTASPTTGR
jgi:Cu/Ag efflux protein CusF